MQRILLSLLLLFSISAKADYINIGGVSYHHKPDKVYNQTNYGAGYEREINSNVNVMAGWYRNSLYKDSYYVLTRYTPSEDNFFGGDVLGGKVNYMIGGISGYRKNVVPVVLPSVCWEYACVFVIPKMNKISNVTTLGLNFRIKI